MLPLLEHWLLPLLRLPRLLFRLHLRRPINQFWRGRRCGQRRQQRYRNFPIGCRTDLQRGGSSALEPAGRTAVNSSAGSGLRCVGHGLRIEGDKILEAQKKAGERNPESRLAQGEQKCGGYIQREDRLKVRVVYTFSWSNNGQRGHSSQRAGLLDNPISSFLRKIAQPFQLFFVSWPNCPYILLSSNTVDSKQNNIQIINFRQVSSDYSFPIGKRDREDKFTLYL